MNTILQIYRKAYAHRKSIFLIGKILIAILLIYAIYRHIYGKGDFHQMKALFLDKLSNSDPIYIVLVLFLMPLNWWLESRKWQTLLGPFQDIGLRKSIYSVLTGTCLAIITPGRLGEYGGRLFYVEDGNRLLGIRATFVGSILQNIINTFIGFVCLLLLQHRLHIVSDGDMSIFLIIVGAVLLGLLVIYLLRKHIIFFALKIFPSLRDRLKSLFDMSSYSRTDLSKVAIYSFLRYGVYVLQYMLVIKFFDVTDDMFASLLGVGVIYLFQTLLPLPPMLSIFARGEIAVVIWSYLSGSVLGVLSATFTLWIINLLIPAVAGYFLLLKMKVR